MRKKKGALLKVVCIVLSIVFAAAFPLYAFAAVSGLPTSSTITSGGYYYIRNKNSNHYLDAEHSYNSNVIQYQFTGALNQVWKITILSNGKYRIENQDSTYQSYGNKFLGVSSTTNNVALHTSNSSSSTQQWSFSYNSDGSFYIKSAFGTNQVLETQDAATSSPYNVQRYTLNNSQNCQRWYLEKIPQPTSSVSSLMAIFPNNNYWNHTPANTNSYTSSTTSGCTHHGNGTCLQLSGGFSYNGKCGCNCYNSAIQCQGYGYYIGYRLYGSNVTNWSKITSTSATEAAILSFIKPGDFIRYQNGSYTHTVIVTAVPDTVSFIITDVNSDGHCKIRWNHVLSKSSLTGNLIYVYKAPYALV